MHKYGRKIGAIELCHSATSRPLQESGILLCQVVRCAIACPLGLALIFSVAIHLVLLFVLQSLRWLLMVGRVGGPRGSHEATLRRRRPRSGARPRRVIPDAEVD
jgi:hypothetical protein